MSFADLGLVRPLIDALTAAGLTDPTEVQRAAVPALLAGGDVRAVAPTGTGKTLAYLLPVLQQLAGRPSTSVGAVVVAPTRELAMQVRTHATPLADAVGRTVHALVGGVDEGPQVAALRAGVQLVVATPGRLLHLHRLGHLDLSQVAHLVLDEADQLLDAGFSSELDAILELVPSPRQTTLWSATFPGAVARLADRILTDPEVVTVQGALQITREVCFVRANDKRALMRLLLDDPAVTRALVFCRTRASVERWASSLAADAGPVTTLHGGLTQAGRSAAVAALDAGEARVLVTTDVAARGLDLPALSHVFHVELPHEPTTFVHRVGRTGRAGEHGATVVLCDESDGGRLRDLERAIGTPLAPRLDHPFHDHDVIPDFRASATATTAKRKRPRGRKPRRR